MKKKIVFPTLIVLTVISIALIIFIKKQTKRPEELTESPNSKEKILSLRRGNMQNILGSWLLKSYGKKGKMKKTLEKKRKPIIKFGENNEVSGYAGPNFSRWSARYKIGKKNLTTEITIESLKYAMYKLGPPYPPGEELAQSNRFMKLLKTVKSFQLNNLKNIEKTLTRLNIEFVGIRFSKLDKQKENFNYKEAEKQTQEFKYRLGLGELN